MKRWLVVLATIAACDPPREPQADAEPPQVERAASPAPALAAVALARAQPLSITLAEVRRIGEAVEIEVALDRKLPPTGGSRPTLQVGERTLRRSRRPQGQLDRLVFLLSPAEVDALEDGATLIVRDRGYSSEQMESPPRLDKSKLVVTP